MQRGRRTHVSPPVGGELEGCASKWDNFAFCFSSVPHSPDPSQRGDAPTVATCTSHAAGEPYKR